MPVPKNKSKTKRPTDINQLAHFLVATSTDESAHRSPISEYLAAIGQRGGKKGGPARAKKLSARRRKVIAKMGAKAHWDNYKKTKGIHPD